jgi:hypothetical protein
MDEALTTPLLAVLLAVADALLRQLDQRAVAVIGEIGSWSLAGYGRPSTEGWIPSISAGWGHDRFAFANHPVAGLSGVRTTSWYLGLN